MELLTIELIPESAWGSNLRKVLSNTDWDTVRRYCYKQAGHVCQCCGGVGPKHPVECHERWEWLINPETRQTRQVLVGVIALCPTCHQVKHWGRTMAVKPYGPETFEVLLAHIAQVNKWTLQQTMNYVERQFRWWIQANSYQWDLDVDSWLSERLQAGDFSLYDYRPKPNPLVG